MKIGLGCLDTVYSDVQGNLEKARKAIVSASEHACDLLVFPEMAITGYGPASVPLAESNDVEGILSTYSREYRLPLLYGHVHREGHAWYNCAVLTDEMGVKRYSYRKIHPFTLADEQEYISAGTVPGIAEFDEMPLGLTVCYDLRFSELYRMLSFLSPLVVNIAAWPHKRDEQYRPLLKARAIEFQFFSIGVNQGGLSPSGEAYGGHPLRLRSQR